MNPTNPERQGRGRCLSVPRFAGCRSASTSVHRLPGVHQGLQRQGYHFHPGSARRLQRLRLCGLYCPDSPSTASVGETSMHARPRARRPPQPPCQAGRRTPAQDPEPADPKGVLTGIHFMDATTPPAKAPWPWLSLWSRATRSRRRPRWWSVSPRASRWWRHLHSDGRRAGLQHAVQGAVWGGQKSLSVTSGRAFL